MGAEINSFSLRIYGAIGLYKNPAYRRKTGFFFSKPVIYEFIQTHQIALRKRLSHFENSHGNSFSLAARQTHIHSFHPVAKPSQWYFCTDTLKRLITALGVPFRWKRQWEHSRGTLFASSCCGSIRDHMHFG